MKKIIVIMCWLGFSAVGCSTFDPWTKLQKEEYTDKARGFKASIPVGWMRSNYKNFFLMTWDGMMLNRISVIRTKFDEVMEETKRKFTSEMTPHELSEVQIDILKSNPDVTNVVINENKPFTIEGKSGFLLKYTCLTKDGLKFEGRAIGFANDKWVYRIFYEAPSQHYFNAHLKDFEKFLSSFQLVE